jgi:AcrR family transcriptional regulator
MRTIPNTSPRRRPRQARAQVTVEAIVQATAKVLVAGGYDRASTNRVAQAAGVSIGSLYQYFPSKEALVAALAAVHVERMKEALHKALGTGPSAGLSEGARRVARALIAAYRVDPALHTVLCEEVPRVGELEDVYAFERWLLTHGREELEQLRAHLRIGDVERAIFLLGHALPGVIRAAVRTDPDGRDDARLAEELAELGLRYLVEGVPARRDSMVAPRGASEGSNGYRLTA